jgi:hypothetical protein
MRGGLRATAPVTFAILALCVGIWVLGFLSQDFGAIAYAYGAQANVLVAQGEWYRLFTAAFLHAPGTLLGLYWTLFGIGATGGQFSGGTTLGRIGFGYIYPQFKAQMTYSTAPGRPLPPLWIRVDRADFIDGETPRPRLVAARVVQLDFVPHKGSRK